MKRRGMDLIIGVNYNNLYTDLNRISQAFMAPNISYFPTASATAAMVSKSDTVPRSGCLRGYKNRSTISSVLARSERYATSEMSSELPQDLPRKALPV